MSKIDDIRRRRFLKATAGSVGGLLLPGLVEKALAITPNNPTGNPGMADIEHLIVSMQENRSFDHYFGMLPGVRVAPRAAMLVASTDQLPQVGSRMTIRGLHDQGRTLDLTLDRRRSSVALTRRPVLQVETTRGLITFRRDAMRTTATAGHAGES